MKVESLFNLSLSVCPPAACDAKTNKSGCRRPINAPELGQVVAALISSRSRWTLYGCRCENGLGIRLNTEVLLVKGTEALMLRNKILLRIKKKKSLFWKVGGVTSMGCVGAVEMWKRR